MSGRFPKKLASLSPAEIADSVIVDLMDDVGGSGHSSWVESARAHLIASISAARRVKDQEVQE